MISPKLNKTDALLFVENNYDIIANVCHKLDGYDDLNFRIVPPILSKMNNKHTQICEYGFVLKVLHWEENYEEFVDEYIKVLTHLKNESLPCPNLVKNKRGEYKTYWQSNEQASSESNKYNHVALLLDYTPGKLLQDIKINNKICVSLGRLIGQLHMKLEPFSSSKILRRPNFIWSMNYLPNILEHLDVVEEQDKRMLIMNIVEEFKIVVLSQIDKLEHGIIHGDINEGNIIVTHNGDDLKIDLIDFFDMSHSCYLFELAIVIAYMALMDIENVIDSASSILSSYKRPLTPLEFDLLKICICARLCQSLVLGLHTYKNNPSNEYLLETQRNGWLLLNKLSEMNNDVFTTIIQDKIKYFNQ